MSPPLMVVCHLLPLTKEIVKASVGGKVSRVTEAEVPLAHQVVLVPRRPQVLR